MKKTNKAISSCAITRLIHTLSMAPHLPVIPPKEAAQSLVAAQAGSSILPVKVFL